MKKNRVIFLIIVFMILFFGIIFLILINPFKNNKVIEDKEVVTTDDDKEVVTTDDNTVNKDVYTDYINLGNSYTYRVKNNCKDDQILYLYNKDDLENPIKEFVGYGMIHAENINNSTYYLLSNKIWCTDMYPGYQKVVDEKLNVVYEEEEFLISLSDKYIVTHYGDYDIKLLDYNWKYQKTIKYDETMLSINDNYYIKTDNKKINIYDYDEKIVSTLVELKELEEIRYTSNVATKSIDSGEFNIDGSICVYVDICPSEKVKNGPSTCDNYVRYYYDSKTGTVKTLTDAQYEYNRELGYYITKNN